ncbi:choline transporter-like protein 2 isoform X2 [Diabrotica virgifera virgifera]|uniref:Choline transporter-like protein n=1 Tax=Diabrotica virgifera virgifera TaxID=50390 RepID=A0ABM5L3Z3_DIAVI|nr:choline transporter-like protein 2 isoform X2 [Diabrotica virgifera virgifera]
MTFQYIELNSDPEPLIPGTMEGSLSKLGQPDEFIGMKNPSTNNFSCNTEIPERPENRKPTDQKFLIAFAVAVIILLPFLIYTLVYSDLDHYKGYDQCGNVCGQKNKKYDNWACSGEDNTNKPYLLYYTSVHNLEGERKCVERCEDGDYPGNGAYCTKITSSDDFGDGLSDYLNKHAGTIVFACFLSLGVGLIMLFLFKSATDVVVWVGLVGALFSGTIFVLRTWYVYFNFHHVMEERIGNVKYLKEVFLFAALVYTSYISIQWFLTVFRNQKIQLVIKLIKEATKAASDMPQLFFIPIITFLMAFLTLGLLAFTTYFMYSSGVLTELKPDFLYYKQNTAMQCAMIFNIFIAVWIIMSIFGVQYMVISGAVTKWYWSKNKRSLESPICSSARLVFKYHLGSVVFESLITLIALPINMFIGAFGFCLRIVSKNAYVLIAMHGTPFYKSGKKAAKVVSQNASSILSINFVGDFILGIAQGTIVQLSVLITLILTGFSADAPWFFLVVVYSIVVFVSFFVAFTCFSIFEAAVDTIFLCFCEDSLLNNGMERPYAMSRDLMEFVDHSMRVWKQDERFAPIMQGMDMGCAPISEA